MIKVDCATPVLETRIVVPASLDKLGVLDMCRTNKISYATPPSNIHSAQKYIGQVWGQNVGYFILVRHINLACAEPLEIGCAKIIIKKV